MYYRITLITLISVSLCAGCASTSNDCSVPDVYNGNDYSTSVVLQARREAAIANQADCLNRRMIRDQKLQAELDQAESERKKKEQMKDPSCYDSNGNFDPSYCNPQ